MVMFPKLVKKGLKDPKGILQITPESLESLLINKNTELIRLFGDLQFVIIDEMRSGSERGCQILCQLAAVEICAKIAASDWFVGDTWRLLTGCRVAEQEPRGRY